MPSGRRPSVGSSEPWPVILVGPGGLCVAPLSARYPLKPESEPNLGNSQNQMIIGHELGLKSPTHSLTCSFVRSLLAQTGNLAGS